MRGTGHLVARTNDHTHAPVTSRPDALRAHNTMKCLAVETQEAPQQIISSCVEGLSAAAAAQIPELNTVRRVVRRQRQQADNPLPLPVDLAAMEVPDVYRMTVTGEQLLQADCVVQHISCCLPQLMPFRYFVRLTTGLWMGHSRPALISSTKCTPSMPSNRAESFPVCMPC